LNRLQSVGKGHWQKKFKAVFEQEGEQNRKPLVREMRGSVLPGELGTGSGGEIMARHGSLVKGGFFGCSAFPRERNKEDS
jgi:hypothetical protein